MAVSVCDVCTVEPTELPRYLGKVVHWMYFTRSLHFDNSSVLHWYSTLDERKRRMAAHPWHRNIQPMDSARERSTVSSQGHDPKKL